jgi:acyl-CoA reductase-like NAD-dependent aldehyde dehydrogenase
MRMGNGLEDGVVMGRLTTPFEHEKVAGLVQAGARDGTVLLGGEIGEGQFHDITIISDLDDQHPLVTEEQFGPAVPLLRYRDVEDALERANATDAGLGGSIWTNDMDKAKSLALRMECGSVWINKHGALQPHAPFGGVKKSGLGVEFGDEGLMENTDIQVVHQ